MPLSQNDYIFRTSHLKLLEVKQDIWREENKVNHDTHFKRSMQELEVLRFYQMKSKFTRSGSWISHEIFRLWGLAYIQFQLPRGERNNNRRTAKDTLPLFWLLHSLLPCLCFSCFHSLLSFPASLDFPLFSLPFLLFFLYWMIFIAACSLLLPVCPLITPVYCVSFSCAPHSHAWARMLSLFFFFSPFFFFVFSLSLFSLPFCFCFSLLPPSQSIIIISRNSSREIPTDLPLLLEAQTPLHPPALASPSLFPLLSQRPRDENPKNSQSFISEPEGRKRSSIWNGAVLDAGELVELGRSWT